MHSCYKSTQGPALGLKTCILGENDQMQTEDGDVTMKHFFCIVSRLLARSDRLSDPYTPLKSREEILCGGATWVSTFLQSLC